MKKEKLKCIRFCSKCKFKEEIDLENEGFTKCPKCDLYTLWTIYEHKVFEKGTLLFSEAGLTDNDEVSFHGDTLYNLKRIFGKGYKLFKLKSKDGGE